MREQVAKWLAQFELKRGQEDLEPVMTIGEAARAAHLSESALRKYESAGLILYHRSRGNVRVLSREDLERIQAIQGLIKKHGLNTEGIRRLWSLLPCWEIKDCHATDKSECPSYGKCNQPCWMCATEKDTAHVYNCKACLVYRTSPAITDDIGKFVHNAEAHPFCKDAFEVSS